MIATTEPTSMPMTATTRWERRQSPHQCRWQLQHDENDDRAHINADDSYNTMRTTTEPTSMPMTATTRWERRQHPYQCRWKLQHCHQHDDNDDRAHTNADDSYNTAVNTMTTTTESTSKPMKAATLPSTRWERRQHPHQCRWKLQHCHQHDDNDNSAHINADDSFKYMYHCDDTISAQVLAFSYVRELDKRSKPFTPIPNC